MVMFSLCRGFSQLLDIMESLDIVGIFYGLGKIFYYLGLVVDWLFINGGVFVEIYFFKYYVYEI